MRAKSYLQKEREREREDGVCFFFTGRTQLKPKSVQGPGFHNSLCSLFLIIRASCIQTKADLVPKFMSLCVTATKCVLYAFSWKLNIVTLVTQLGLFLSCILPTQTATCWQIFLKL